MTISERRLWVCLRSDFEVKFRRQEPIGSFICDFVCYSRRLVVEVDGSQHLDNPRDVERDRYLRRCGFAVLRVASWDVMAELPVVLDQVAAALEERRNIHRRGVTTAGQDPFRRPTEGWPPPSPEGKE